MCLRTYSVGTGSSTIEVSKGTYLTLLKRQQQTRNTRSTTAVPAKSKQSKLQELMQTKECFHQGKLKKKEVMKKEGNSMMRRRVKTRQSEIRLKSIARKISNLSSLKESEKVTPRMDEESTWSHIQEAVYSLSLSLSAANYDHMFC